MHCKTFSILLRVSGHFVMSITKNHEPHYVTVLDNPRIGLQFFIATMLAVSRSFCLHEYDYIKKRLLVISFKFFFLLKKPLLFAGLPPARLSIPTVET